MSVEDHLARRFIARPDVMAIQHRNGAWNPVTTDGKADGPRVKFTRADLQAHVAGTKSLGHYMLSTDSKCKLFAFDLDLDKTGYLLNGVGDLEEVNPREIWLVPDHPGRVDLAVSLFCIATGLAYRAHRLLGIDIAVSYSGSKGLHVYGFMPDPTDAEDVRQGAIEVLEDFGCFDAIRGKSFFKHRGFGEKPIGYQNLTIEVFPKQISLDGKDLGNLMRLPLGVNPKTQHHAFFIDPRILPDDGQFVPLDPEAALTGDGLPALA